MTSGARLAGRVPRMAIRMADEGIPVNAIVRILISTPSEVNETLDWAVRLGLLGAKPPADWPESTRADRVPAREALPMERILDLAFRIALALNTSVQPSKFLAMMLLPDMGASCNTRASLHAALKVGDRETESKLVDVVCYYARAAVACHGITIENVWGFGYVMHAKNREKLWALIGGKPQEDSHAAA